MPANWKYYNPSWVDIILFLGTIGLFTSLFLLFLRFLPCINIAEVKWAKKESDVLHDDKQAHPDEGTVVEAAYQQEVEKGTAEI